MQETIAQKLQVYTQITVRSEAKTAFTPQKHQKRLDSERTK